MAALFIHITNSTVLQWYV